MNIRNYKHSDFEDIVSWWEHYKEVPPVQGAMMEDSTFVLEINNISALSLTVLFTQSKEIAYIEGFIKNPLFKESLEKQGAELWNHCFDYAKAQGYKRVFCYCAAEPLKNKYERFGMTKSVDKLTAFGREL